MESVNYYIGKTPSLKEQVYNVLRMRIISGELAPGMKLNEEDVSKELGISRAPLREALNMLDRDGFIHIIPRKGAVVTDISPDNIKMLWDIRAMLEPNAAVMAMKNIPGKKLEALEKELKAVQNNPEDFVSYVESDIKVHALFADYLDNHYLRDILRNVKDHSLRMRWNVEHTASNASREAILKSTDEHIAIVQALQKKDEGEIYDIVLRHLIDSKIRTMNVSSGESKKTAEFSCQKSGENSVQDDKLL